MTHTYTLTQHSRHNPNKQVQDPQAMVTYALTVGAAFGCVETLFFYARYGVAVAVSEG